MTVLMVTLILAAGCGLFNAAPSECIAAAEDAGLPDSVIEQLEDPEGLNPLERAALQKAIKRAGIHEQCGKAADMADEIGDTQEPSTNGIERFRQITKRDATREPTKELGTDAQTEPTSEPGAQNEAYAQCLDQLFLQNAGFPITIWHCRDLEARPTETANPTRCRLTSVQATQARYPEWPEELHDWHAISQCIPTPSDDALRSSSGVGDEATRYTRCMDDTYLSITRGADVGEQQGEFAGGISAWMCREHLPEPPPTHRVRCELDHKSRTEGIYPEWPEGLHGWHAAMHCIPEWQPYDGDQDDDYPACLTDVYGQVKQNNSKSVGIPVAIWRCKEQMPEPPSKHSTRCLLNELSTTVALAMKVSEGVFGSDTAWLGPGAAVSIPTSGWTGQDCHGATTAAGITTVSPRARSAG